METVYILLSVCIVLAAAAITLGVIYILKFSKKSEAGGGAIDDKALEKIKSDTETTVKIENSMLSGVINTLSAKVDAQNQSTRDITARFDNFMAAVDVKLDKMRDDNAKNLAAIKENSDKSLAEVRADNVRILTAVRDDNNKNLAKMQEDNSKQLEKMRETVDEKLSSTLEQRFKQSFAIVGERLEAINKSFGELQTLQNGVNDLKGVFGNIKTRGMWGEVALENLLSQILTEDQYAKQYNISRSSKEAVDFAIRMPGKGDGEVVLPIDSKFPLEDYQRLIEASEKVDAAGVEAAGKALEKRIKQEAQSIRDKYIKPPMTTDFAILYLPVEGLFAEVVKRHGLMEELQTKHRVVVCGPTTITALLNSLQMGFKSVAIEKRSTEIGKLLAAFVGDFEKFSTLLQKTKIKLENVQTTISDADKRTEIIRKKLAKVSGYGIERGGDMMLEGYVASNGDEPLAAADAEDNTED